jgi:hypothetical protein
MFFNREGRGSQDCTNKLQKHCPRSGFYQFKKERERWAEYLQLLSGAIIAQGKSATTGALQMSAA